MNAWSEHVPDSPTPGHDQDDLPLLDNATQDRGNAWPLPSPEALQTVRRKPVPSFNHGSHNYTQLDDEDISSARLNDYTISSNVPSNTAPPRPLVQVPNADQRHNVLQWLPYSFHWSYLSILVLVSLGLLALIAYLDTRSRRDDGLIDDDDQPILFFGWRFVPTLLAVLYALAISILLEDIKRTEPYVRLAKPKGASAEYTVLQVPGAWYNALADGFSRTKNQGSLSWCMICSALCVALSSLVISPLSSTLLVSQPVNMGVETEFRTFSVSPTTPLDLSEQPMTRFHTISNLLQGVTTSAWLLDDYAVLPFWPSSLLNTPMGAILGTSSETWRGNSTVFTASLECQPMTLRSKSLANFTIPYVEYGITNNDTDLLGTMVLEGNDGCSTGIAARVSTPFARFGGGSWARPGVIAFTIEKTYSYDNALKNSSNAELALNYTAQCTGSERIILTSQWFLDSAENTWTDNVQAVGLNCAAAYYYANMTVNVEVGNSSTALMIDEGEFLAKRQPLDSSMFDIAEFEDMFLNTSWSTHLSTPAGTNRPAAGGPSAVLAAMYGFSMEAAMADTNLATQVTRLKQRYLGEVLSSALTAKGNQSVPTTGLIYTIRRRVVVVHPIAIAMEAMLGITTLLLAIVLALTRLNRRKMSLSSDPAYIASAANLLGNDSHIGKDFKALKNASTKQQHHALRSKVYHTSSGRLFEVTGAVAKWSRGDSESDLHDPSIAHSNKSFPMIHAVTDWRRFVVKRWVIAGLGVALLAYLIAVVLLYHFSERSQLYQRAFVYQVDIDVSGHHLSTIAPYSIIPTLLAVGTGLWWGAMETDFRVMQPYLNIIASPTSWANGVQLTYQSSYLLWAAIKAANRGHWILCIVSTGAVFSQIFITSMSALWALDVGTRTVQMSLSRTLEPRVIPVLSLASQPSSADIGAIAAAQVLAQLYGDLQTNWLYGATIEMTLNGTQPPWSDNGWSFVPVDLSSLDTMISGNATSNASTSIGTISTVNLTTPALRGRLECSEYPAISNLSTWLTLTNPRNSSIWNTTANRDIGESAYVLGCYFGGALFQLMPNISSPYACDGSMQTSFFNNPYRIACCENETDDGRGQAAIAYWSENTLSNYNDSQNYTNFTVKWIYGTPVSNMYETDNYDSMMLWPEKPQMAALHCQPIIEKADAEVQIELPSGRVRSHKILSEPVLDEDAFTDQFVEHPAINSTAFSQNNILNVTTSYGWLFLTALLRAADLHHVNLGNNGQTVEDLQDNTFNFRQPGINMDYMSYSMFMQVGQDKQALLDHTMLYAVANKTFATFFQHFMSSNISLTEGGLSYQKINEQLPIDLPVAYTYDGTNRTRPIPRPVSTTNRTVDVVVTIPVKMLRMSPVAVLICVSILVWLILSVLVVVLLDRQHLGRVLRGTRTLSDVAILLAGSDALLTYMASGQADQPDAHRPQVKLGWFRDKDGQPRWGIELVGEEFGVEWLDENEIAERKQEKGKKGAYEMVDMADPTESGSKVNNSAVHVRYDDVSEIDAHEVKD